MGGVNQFTDMTTDEFVSQYMVPTKSRAVWGDATYLGAHTHTGRRLADSVDWVAAGAVTPVKNQGQSGAYCSFSTVGALEGAWQIATKKLVPLSEQEFVDCDHGDDGIKGGLMDSCFQFAEQNALCTEESYPYKAKRGTCQKATCTVGIPQGGVIGFKDVESGDEQAMMSAVKGQPVSVAIEADKAAFQLYHGGVLSTYCGTKLDHGVLLVGYVRMLRGKGGAGECGLLTQASYPVVDGSVPPS